MKKTTTIITGILGVLLLGTVMAFTPFKTNATSVSTSEAQSCEAYRQWCISSRKCAKIKDRSERQQCNESVGSAPKKPTDCRFVCVSDQ